MSEGLFCLMCFTLAQKEDAVRINAKPCFGRSLALPVLFILLPSSSSSSSSHSLHHLYPFFLAHV